MTLENSAKMAAFSVYNDESSSSDNGYSKPLANRLFFAGEAASVNYPSTVHGAYLSGQKAAKKIKALV